MIHIEKDWLLIRASYQASYQATRRLLINLSLENTVTEVKEKGEHILMPSPPFA